MPALFATLKASGLNYCFDFQPTTTVGKRSSRQKPYRKTLGIRRAQNGHDWIFSHPAAVREVAEDLDEVRQIIEAGEIEIAIDELRWLLGTSSEILEAHFLLGKLAVEHDHDTALARGHFGVGYQLGLRALKRAKWPTPVPALHPANQIFFDCGRGLAWCLVELDRREMAREVVEQLLKLDPADPLNLKSWLEEIDLGNRTIVEPHFISKPG